MNTKQLKRGLRGVVIFAIAFAIAFALRNQVSVAWPTLGALIGFSVYVVATIWLAVRHGPRALLPH